MKLRDLSEIGMSKLVDDFILELDTFTWKHEGDFIIFLNELEEYLAKNKTIDTEKFLYEDNEFCNTFTCKRDYDKYIDSFCNLIYSYCRKYNLPEINDSIEENLYFNEYCVLVKLNNIYYKVERISGQGTIDIITLYEGENKELCVEYEYIINDREPRNYTDLCRSIVNKALKDFKEEFKNQIEVLNCDICIVDKDNIK